VASLQTQLTAWKNAAVEVTLTLQNGAAISGIITDDGTVGDSIIVKGADKNGVAMTTKGTTIPKSVICTVPEN